LGVVYLPNALPGSGIKFHEPDAAVNSLWAMASLEKSQSLPVGPRLDNGVLFMEPGEERMVTVAFRNPSAEKVRFMAEPYQVHPASQIPHTWLTCYCLAFVYEALAEGAWYRAIRLTIAPDTEPGSKVDAIWTILTDPEWFPMEKPELAAAAQAPEAQATKTEVSPELAAQGKRLATQYGCTSCRSVDGTPGAGPTWQELFGSTRPLADGSKVEADEAYLRESIVSPNAKVAQGFSPGIMPQDYGEKLSDEQLDAMIEFIESVD
jgi:cytochrome c1